MIPVSRWFWMWAISGSLLVLAGCRSVERYQAMQAATTAPARLTDGDMELAIDAYLWRDEQANEAQGYLQLRVVAFDVHRQAVHQAYRLVECQVIRPDRLGMGPMAGGIGQYRLASERNAQRIGLIACPEASQAFCLWVKHDLATTGLSPGYDVVLILEKPGTGQRWALRTANQPVHRIEPPSDWFAQAMNVPLRPSASEGSKAQ